MVVDARGADREPWRPRHGKISTRWLAVDCQQKVEIRRVTCMELGATKASRSPVLKAPAGIKAPEKKDVATVRMSIQAKHVEGTLNTKIADNLLRDIWPAGMRGARSFGEWREEREKGRLVALTTYVTTTVQSADELCNGSGMVNAVLVSRLARDCPATTTGAMHWTVRGELDDIEYIRAARAEAAKHGATGLVHRLGWGKDLGFVRKDLNLRATGPHLWVARAPIWWTAEDLAGFLGGAGWSDVTIVGRHHRAWTFRAAERPADNTAYMYEVGEDTLSVVPKQRKASARETGRALARPTLPWAEADRQKEQQKRDEEVRAMEVDAVKSGDDGSRTDGDREARDGTEGGSALRDDGDGTAVATEQGKLGPAAKRQKTDDKVGDGLQAYFREEELKDKFCPLVGYRAVEAGGGRRLWIRVHRLGGPARRRPRRHGGRLAAGTDPDRGQDAARQSCPGPPQQPHVQRVLGRRPGAPGVWGHIRGLLRPRREAGFLD